MGVPRPSLVPPRPTVPPLTSPFLAPILYLRPPLTAELQLLAPPPNIRPPYHHLGHPRRHHHYLQRQPGTTTPIAYCYQVQLVKTFPLSQHHAPHPPTHRHVSTHRSSPLETPPPHRAPQPPSSPTTAPRVLPTVWGCPSQYPTNCGAPVPSSYRCFYTTTPWLHTTTAVCPLQPHHHHHDG